MPPFQKIPYSWRWLVYLLPILVVAPVLTAGLYDGLDPETCSAPLVLPITAPVFTTIDGETKHLSPPLDELVHTEPLGKRICILDVDTRDFSDNGGAFFFFFLFPTWKNLGSPAAGFLNHHLYAIITATLMIDSDAMFTTPTGASEWLLNYWKARPEVLVATAEDAMGNRNNDIRGRVNRLFKDWAECPYTSATIFFDGYSIDSHALSIHTRQCNEANGYPKVFDCGYVGQFARHYWVHKNLTIPKFNHNVMTAFTPLLVKTAYNNLGNVEDYRDMVLEGAQLLG
ncbi:hypothetical protein C7999DRAFT_43316 [Corynascus novoguineensis]|uniref:Nucleotide-diphospho-sugar transferase domain-containing protein n=1 Tax=Corynascus novoguineensis TaxID=1126955 RepID=A0AAN7CNX0_9PEZI|nr:hypothetical protein C7999DRAFT_43316 [Corynascus novoguineensis]